MTDHLDADSDVPYSEDLQSPAGAKAWAEEADLKRPLRKQIRSAIVERLRELEPGSRVLELGSGPGLLAEQILRHCTTLASYTLLDFSEPMLEMSRHRIAAYPSATFVIGDFRSETWTDLVTGPFEAVVSMQAVHEVRHKRHVPRLYRQIYSVLADTGTFLVADRAPADDSLRSTALFMTEREQAQTLTAAGFVDVRVVMAGDALVLCECRKPARS